MINEWDLARTNQSRLKENMPEVIIIPTCAIEPHNLHLPLGQDFLHTTWIADQACERAWKHCQKVACLPAIPYGVDCNLLDFPLAAHISQDTLNAVLKDLIISMKTYGIKKFVIINGHGGNDFTPFVRQVQSDLDVHVFVSNWWTVAMDRYKEIFDKPDDHAGEFETSVALALFPELVEYEKAGKAIPKPFRFDALNKGWVKTSRRFSRLNEFCAAGDPADATAEKGHKVLEIVVERLSQFLVELAEEEIDELFPQGGLI
jgi:creatinine amidohydrolase